MKEISLYHLPMGWETATIDNLIGVNGLFVDGDWIESKDQNPNGGIRLYNSLILETELLKINPIDL